MAFFSTRQFIMSDVDQRACLKEPRRLLPRFSLRALLLGVFVVAVLIQIGGFAWRKFIRYREAREYHVLQAPKSSMVEANLRAAANGSHKSSAIDYGRPIPDGFVILVRRGNLFGCFIPRKQHQRGESLEYDWYYRTDGLGRFDTDQSSVKHGHSFAGPYKPGSGQLVTIKFGPFAVEWSGHGPDWGFLYYDDDICVDPVPTDQLRICATNHKSVEFLDGKSNEWIYKAYLVDPGVPGNIDCNAPVARRSLRLSNRSER
jgi:hypothetical protein